MHRFRVQDRVEVFGPIDICNICIAAAEKCIELFDRIGSARSRAMAAGTGIEVHLKDRLKNQRGSGLHRPIPYSWNTERPPTIVPALWVHAALAAGGKARCQTTSGAGPMPSDGMSLVRGVSWPAVDL